MQLSPTNITIKAALKRERKTATGNDAVLTAPAFRNSGHKTSKPMQN